MTNPTEDDLESANRCIRYLYKTRFTAILYSGKGTASVFQAASDAAFADDSESRKSSEAFLFKLFGGPISWAAKKLSNVTISTTEAELASLSRAATHLKWWSNFFDNIGFNPEHPMHIMCDNQAAIAIATGKVKQSSKYRTDDIHRRWLQQETARKWITISYIPTAQMPADVLTKMLTKNGHKNFQNHLNMSDISKMFEKNPVTKRSLPHEGEQ